MNTQRSVNDWLDYLEHYNHNHGPDGRFTWGPGGRLSSNKNTKQTAPKSVKMQDKRISRLDKMKIGKRINVPFTKGAKPAAFSFQYSDNSDYRKPTPNMVKAATDIMQNSDLIDARLKKQALNNLYKPYKKYGFGTESKSEFEKKLYCAEIQVVDHNYSDDPDFPSLGDEPLSDSTFWYTHPDYGDWMIEYDTKRNKIVYQEFFR